MYNTIIIGSGPAGLMCAKYAGDCLVLEKNNVAGKKLLITGGGRCNLTNDLDVKSFLSELNNDFLKFSLRGMNPNVIVKEFSSELPLKNEDGKIFPVSDKSSDVVNYLTNGVNIKYSVEVLNINKDDFFRVETNAGIFVSKNLVIATGGASYPNLGSTGDGYKFAKNFGHKIVPIYPALVMLKTQDFNSLVGSSFEVLINCDGNKAKGSMIVTHRGLSGPAIFKISEHVKDFIFINFLPEFNMEKLTAYLNDYKQNRELISFLRFLFSEKLADFIVEKVGIDKNIKISNIKKEYRKKLFDTILNFKVFISSKGNLSEAIVTGGGVDTEYVNPKTMESKLVEGLYFVGEVMDVHGPTGGYNITIALSSGYTAGSSIANKSCLWYY